MAKMRISTIHNGTSQTPGACHDGYNPSFIVSTFQIQDASKNGAKEFFCDFSEQFSDLPLVI